MVGELALSGEIRRVRGVLPITLEMRKKGEKGIPVPEQSRRNHRKHYVSVVEAYPKFNRNQRQQQRPVVECRNTPPIPNVSMPLFLSVVNYDAMRVPVFLAELCGGNPFFPAEISADMLNIGKLQFISNLRYGHVGLNQKL